MPLRREDKFWMLCLLLMRPLGLGALRLLIYERATQISAFVTVERERKKKNLNYHLYVYLQLSNIYIQG